MIQIRTAEKKDLEQLRDFAIMTCVDTFGEFNTHENMSAFLKEAYDMDKLEEELREEGAVYFLAWDEDFLVGFERLRLSDEVERYLGKNTIELQRLYIHPGYKRKKIGSLMMEKAFAYAREHAFEWLWLGVWERNFNAQQFYTKWGFEKFADHIFTMGNDPQLDWLMSRKVTQIEW